MTETHAKQGGKSGAGGIDEGARQRFEAIINAIRVEQKAIAKRLGITAPYVSQLKTGLRPLAASVAQKVEEEFGISSGWLLHGRGRLVADRRKAVQQVDLGALPSECLDDYDVYLARCALDGIQGVTGIPLLEDLTDHPPAALTEFTGARFHLPQPGVGALYIVKAGARWGPTFRRDELLLIEQRGPGEWALQELDREFCVVRRSPARPLELCQVQAVGPGEPGDLRLTPLAGVGSATATAELHEIEIFGIVLMAFRTSVEMSTSPYRQTALFEDAEDDKPQATD